MTAPTYSLAASCIKTGSVADFVLDGTTVTLTSEADLFSARSVGEQIVVANSTTAGNDGTFKILTVADSKNCTYANADGATESGKGSSATTLKLHDVKVGEPFELTLTVTSSSATYNIQVYDMVPVHVGGNFAFANINVQGSTAGGGMKQVTTGFSDPASNINVPAPVTVATGAIGYFSTTVVPLSKSNVATTYKLQILPKVMNVTSAALETVVPTPVSVIF